MARRMKAAMFVALAILFPVVCNGNCDIATLLPLTKPSWTIGSDENYEFIEDQRCFWRFPTINFQRDDLFLYISPFDFSRKNRCVGDLALDDFRLCSTFEPECVLFTENLTIVDLAYIEKEVGFEEDSCITWRIQRGILREISLRTFEPVSNLTFKVQYQYIPQRTDRISTTEAAGHARTKCTGYIIAFALTLFGLCVTLILLAKCACKRILLTGKRQPRVRGSFFQTESIDDDVDEEALRSPVPLTMSKSPSRRGNTSCFFQSMEAMDEAGRTNQNGGRPKSVESLEGLGPNDSWDANGEPYYDVPKSTPVYSVVRKKTSVNADKTEYLRVDSTPPNAS